MATSIALTQSQPLGIFKRVGHLIPGVLLLIAVGYGGKFIERSIALYGRAHHLTLPNVEYVLWAIVLGLIIANTTGVPAVFKPGLATYEFWLKAGIVLLGSRFLLGDVLKLGGVSLVLVAIEIALSLTFMTALGKAFGLKPKLTTLLAVGSSICGVSAIIATQGAIDADEEDSSTAIAAILALGDDLAAVWDAPSTTDKDRKQLLRTLLDEVKITVCRDHDGGRADLLLRWKGGAITELTVPLKRKPPKIRTDEDTVALVRRLAVHYPDAKIAGILNRQGRTTPRGMSYTAGRVQGLRHYWGIPCHQPTGDPQEGELLTVADAAAGLGLAPSTLHRWLGDGFIKGEQLTPGAPWRIRLTPEIRALFVDDAPDGWLAMLEATLAYGVTRQTIMQRVKDGKLRAVHVRTGRRKGLRIEPPATQDGLF